MRRSIALAALLVVLAAVAAPGAASAKGDRDEYPCADPFWHSGVGREVQYCHMWRGQVPIHEDHDPGSRIVGHLKNPTGNWFECQTKGVDYRAPDSAWNDLDGVQSTWWAFTMADGTDEWGWVSGAFFVNGGRNIPNGNFPDGNLADCFGPG
jgi:hypothetical protein